MPQQQSDLGYPVELRVQVMHELARCALQIQQLQQENALLKKCGSFLWTT